MECGDAYRLPPLAPAAGARGELPKGSAPPQTIMAPRMCGRHCASHAVEIQLSSSRIRCYTSGNREVVMPNALLLYLGDSQRIAPEALTSPFPCDPWHVESVADTT